jgi:hypothetical protein
MRFTLPFLFSVIVLTELPAQQVNLQTGSMQYSIPVFSFSDSKSGLSTSVELSYSSGQGLIVSSQAGCTGQNWSLIAGGSIIRKQNGEPDDQNSTSIFTPYPSPQTSGFNDHIACWEDNLQSGAVYARDHLQYYFPNGFMYSEFTTDMLETTPANNPSCYDAPLELAFLPRFKNNMDKRWKLSRRALADRQQDVFLYNFNGVSGEFVIGRDGNPLLLNDAKLVIEKTSSDMTSATPYNIRTRINSFTIKDENGILYKFSAYELSEVMNAVEVSSEGPDNFKKRNTYANTTNKFTIQKWLLTEIANPVTNEKILFEYEDWSFYWTLDRIPSYQYLEGDNVQSVNVYNRTASAKLKRIKKIILPDGHQVEFFYTPNRPRLDLPEDIPLTKIKTTYNGQDVNSFNLTYGYFFKKQIRNYTESIQGMDILFTRLCLMAVQKTGIKVPESPYRFTYYTGSESSDPKDIVPPYHSMAQDHWGFYNKSSIVDDNVYDTPKETLKDLMLNSSTYRQPSAGMAKLGLLKSIDNPYRGVVSFEYEQNDSKDADDPAVTKVAGGVRVSKVTVSDGTGASNDIVTTYNYKLSDGSTSGWGYESPTYLNRRQIKVWNAGNLDGYTQNGVMTQDLTAVIGKMLFKTGAGIVFKAAVRESVTKIVGAAAAPGVVLSIGAMILGGLIERWIVLFNPTDYVWTDIYNYYPYESQNPIGMNYSRVEVANTSIAGGTGKTVHEFTAPANVRSEIPAFVMPYSPKQRFASWKYNMPLKTSVYNQAGTLIKEVSNVYSYFINTTTAVNHRSSKVEVIRPESAAVYAATYAIPLSDFSWEFYYPITGRAQLESSVEKNYSPSAILSTSKQINTYNADYLLSSSKTIRSNGDTILVKNYYTNDYDNISTAIQDMKTYNMVGTLISSETWIKKPNNDEFLIDVAINEYTRLPDGQIKLKKVYGLESREPLAKSLVGEQSRTTLVRNTTYFKEKQVTDYNTLGIPVQVTNDDGEISTTIFDYNNRLPIATVSNAANSNVAYASFEADGKGNWDYNNTPANHVADGVTGLKCFQLGVGNGISKSGLDATKAYTVSYWAKNGSVTVNGAAVSAIYSINGWSLYIHQVPATSTISVAGTALIDELRLYPKGALMSTIAYIPQTGKISECNENNRITYYEYDDSRRVRIVRDENRNIIKMYEYSYKR